MKSNNSFYQSNEPVNLQDAEFFAAYQEESEDEYEDDDGEGLRNIFDVLEEEESDDENWNDVLCSRLYLQYILH